MSVHDAGAVPISADDVVPVGELLRRRAEAERSRVRASGGPAAAAMDLVDAAAAKRRHRYAWLAAQTACNQTLTGAEVEELADLLERTETSHKDFNADVSSLRKLGDAQVEVRGAKSALVGVPSSADLRAEYDRMTVEVVAKIEELNRPRNAVLARLAEVERLEQAVMNAEARFTSAASQCSERVRIL